MASSMVWLDELVREMLLFRGFVATLKTFDAEMRSEKEKAFRVDKLIDHILQLIYMGDLQALRELWSHLRRKIFSRIEDVEQLSSAQRLEHSVLKLYVVHCVQNKRVDRVRDFFDRVGPELQGCEEWREWFALPFTREPENSNQFAVYFTRQWQDALLLSLHNLFAILFASMPLPKLVSIVDTISYIKALREENEALKETIDNLEGKKGPMQSLNELKMPKSKPHEELMDDFFVIAQNQQQQQETYVGGSEVQGRRLKSFLKNITGSSNNNSTTAVATATTSTIASSLGSATSDLRPIKRIIPGNRGIRSTSSNNNDQLSSTCVSTAVSASFIEQRAAAKLSHPPVKRLSQSRPSSSTSLASEQSLLDSRQSVEREDSIGSLRCSSKYLLLSQEDFAEHNDAVHHCKFSPSGALVASGDAKGVVKIWTPTPPTLNTLATFIHQNGAITCLEWLSSGPLVSSDSHLIYGTSSGVIRMCEQQSRRTTAELDLNSELGYSKVSALAVSSNSNVCAVAGVVKENSKLLLTDINANMAIMGSMGDSMAAEMTSLSFNHNNQLIIVGNNEGKVEIYDLRKRDCISYFNASERALSTINLSNDETCIFTLDCDGLLSAWSMYQSGKSLFQQRVLDEPDETVQQSKCVWGKEFALSGQDPQQVVLCNGRRGDVYGILDSGLDKLLSLKSHKQPVISSDWSPLHHPSTVTQTCLTSSTDGIIRVSTLLCQ